MKKYFGGYGENNIRCIVQLMRRDNKVSVGCTSKHFYLTDTIVRMKFSQYVAKKFKLDLQTMHSNIYFQALLENIRFWDREKDTIVCIDEVK